MDVRMCLVCLALLPSAAVAVLTIESYVVRSLLRLTKETFCLGGIVSARTVITACSCIGEFLYEQDKNYYIFKEIDTRNVVLITTEDEYFEIEMTFLHLHCVPSRWKNGSNSFDLGGWKVIGSMGHSDRIVLQPLGAEFEMIYNRVKNCYIASYKAVLEHNLFDLTSNVGRCVKTFCEYVGATDCPVLHDSVDHKVDYCGKCQKSKEELATGSPVYCKVHKQYYIVGVVAMLHQDHFIASRVDKNPNLAFYNVVQRGKFSSSPGLTPQLLLTFALQLAIRFQ